MQRYFYFYQILNINHFFTINAYCVYNIRYKSLTNESKIFFYQIYSINNYSWTFNCNYFSLFKPKSVILYILYISDT